MMFLEVVWVMNAFEKCIEWSENLISRNRNHNEQVSTFAKIWIYRHWIPKKVQADYKYFRGAFAAFCYKNAIQLIELAANDHETNGVVERANHTLQSFFLRFLCKKQKLYTPSVFNQAIEAKNIHAKGLRERNHFNYYVVNIHVF